MLVTEESEISKRGTGHKRLPDCSAVDVMMLWDSWENTDYFVKSHSIGGEQTGPEQGLQVVLPALLLS